MSWGGNDKAEVAQNRLRYLARMGLDPARAVSAEQVHGAEIWRVREEDGGRGIREIGTRIPETDGMVTNVQGLVLATLHADCAPFYYVDEERHVTGLAHAGRRGILAGLPGKMLRVMQEEFGSRPREIKVSIGPMIGTEHYEVRPETADEFRQQFGSQVVVNRGGKPHLDLYAAAMVNLQENGLSNDHVPDRPPCTFEREDMASYRRDGPPARSMMAWLMILARPD